MLAFVRCAMKVIVKLSIAPQSVITMIVLVVALIIIIVCCHSCYCYYDYPYYSFASILIIIVFVPDIIVMGIAVLVINSEA